MAITTDTSTSIGAVRYLIGDDTEGTGVLPNSSNFSDSAISYELSAVGNVVYAAAANLCLNIARRWSNVPQSFSVDGESINRGDVVARWVAMQAEFAAKAQGGSFGNVTLDRQDGYSDRAGASGDDITRGI